MAKKVQNRATEIYVYPVALSIIAPYPAPCGAATPAVPAARYCKRSFGFSRLLSLPQNGIPSTKAMTAEIEALLSGKNARYTECQERKRRFNELLTIKRNIDLMHHGTSSQRRDEVEKLFFEQDRWQEVIKEENKG